MAWSGSCGRPFTDTVFKYNDADILEISCMADYFEDCIDIPAEKVASETVNVETNKLPRRRYPGILLRACKDYSK